MARQDIRTVNLTGAELCVSGLGGQNTVIRNSGSSAVYASAEPDIVPDADGVIEIPAGAAVNYPGTNGTVYLLGSGKVQLVGTDYSTVNFKLPSSSAGGGGSSEKGVLTSPLTLMGGVSDETLSELIEF